MLSDIDKLAIYQKLINELLELNRQLNSYDNVEINLSQKLIIKERWEGPTAKTYEFSLSVIDEIIERIRKKIDYRGKKLKEIKGEKS